MSDDELKRLLDTVRMENSAAHEDTRSPAAPCRTFVGGGKNTGGGFFAALRLRLRRLRMTRGWLRIATANEI